MTYRLGLTGSIGMGKSTTAAMFAAEGCALWDADAAVHRLYAKGGAAVAPMSKKFPKAIIESSVSRDRLKAILKDQPDCLKQIEAIVHPLVAADRASFLEKSQADITVFDIPLLYETGADKAMDAVVCVSVPAEIQENRVLQRPGMTRAHYRSILSKQLSDEEKRKQADFVVITDSKDHAISQVRGIVTRIRKELNNA